MEPLFAIYDKIDKCYICQSQTNETLTFTSEEKAKEVCRIANATNDVDNPRYRVDEIE